MRAIILGCLFAIGLITTGTTSAFSRPVVQIVNKSDATDISARRKHYAKRYKKVRHAARVQVANVAPAATSCNIDSGECSHVSTVYSGGPRGLMKSVTVAAPRATRATRYASKSPTPLDTWGGGSLVAIARSQLGNGPIYGRRNLWCARFVNYVAQRAGYRGTGSDLAADWARGGPRLSGPQVGAIAVMHRGRRGGHVGIVSGVDGNGNPILISGNYNNRVVEAPYPAGRIYAYVMPAK